MKNLLTLLGIALLFSSVLGEDTKPNVLFIVIDDLNDYISVLDNHPNVHSPNFERLARRSVTFTNAHCAAPACHPSRVAVMTGVHPSRSGIYRNAFGAHGPRWRHESPMLKNAVVLSQHFRDHGYYAAGGGKIFHTLQWTPGDSQNDPEAWDDYRGDPLDPISSDWPRPAITQSTNQNDHFVGKRPLRDFHFGAEPVELNEDQGDGAVVDWAINKMQQKHDQPLFLAVGLFRPHIPFEVPQKWFDLYPEDKIELPPYRIDDLKDAHNHGRTNWHKWVTNNNQWRKLMQGYLASISYVDNELGRLLDGLDASPLKDDTIVVLWTDHGFHIGEKDNWEKFALWDQTTRVPCFIHAPGISKDGEKTREPVILTDLYPTLCELAGLPIPDQCDGSSLVSILKNPTVTGERFATTSFQFRGEDSPSHAIADDRYRLIRYGNGFEELYDLREDPNEFANRINDPSLSEIRAYLTSKLPSNAAPQAKPAPKSPYNRNKPSEAANKPAGKGYTEGPIRVLFLGHKSDSHPSDLYYPMLAQALGRDGIYFDYVTTPEEAFGDAAKLSRYDAVLLYANHKTLDRKLWKNLATYVRNGGGFVPVHCASWCFQNILEFDQLVGGRFKSHATGTFSAKTIEPDHPAIAGIPSFEAWDETYYHTNHNPTDRVVLQVREGPDGDPQSGPEPWTWVRKEGSGRVFYTASGHDERVWSLPQFHQLLKSGILWACGDKRRSDYETFLTKRTPLRYQERDNIANYEGRPEPLKFQFPLSAEDSMDYLRMPLGWEVELFASEPDLVNPISMAWDERGRLWVAETVDYPNDVRDGSGEDTIKILEDTNGDGRCDTVKVFADRLNIPTSLTFWDGGIIVAQAPDFLFLKDTDGDDRADVKETILTGWGIHDTHAGPSNLRYGIDNWIYGTVGYSSFNGNVGGRDHKFGSGVFRMKPDGSELEFIHQFNNNTWGLGLNAAGDVFGSTANRNPSFFGGFPQTGYPEGEKGMSAKMIADEIVFHPITPNVRQVDAFGQYTAGAGYALATSNNFPPSWRDRMAFIGGPTGHLLGMFENLREGAGYKAINRFHLLASADEWFSPVAAEVGPDGNLWVADWYNFIIQHNPTPTRERGGYTAVRGIGNAHKNPLRDKQHGRIYRVVWEGAQASSISSLEGASEKQLLNALSHHNQFWRLTAQRLIVARKLTGLTPSLKALLKNSSGVPASHALWTLNGLGTLDKESHQFALLKAGDPILKRNAIRAISTDEAGRQLFFDTAVVQAKDPLVRLTAFAKLAHFSDKEGNEQIANRLILNGENNSDEWLATALRASGAGNVKRGPLKIMGPNLLPNPSFEEVTQATPREWEVRSYSGIAEHIVVADESRTGKRSLCITSTRGADTSFFTEVKVKPNTEYRLTGWVKTARLLGARGAQMNAHEVQKQPRGSRTNALNRTTPEWRRVEATFNSLNRDELTINCLFGGWGKATGTAWWDDVALHEVEYEAVIEAEPEVTGGNPSRGKKIFETHSVAACSRCHAAGGQGGSIGPALDGIASRKSKDYIRESLVEPQANIAEGFQIEVSPMPPMGVLLKEQELEDVMAYLMTLRN